MSSFVTRHTRAQLTTENVVFDKVLLLLVLFVQMERWWHCNGVALPFFSSIVGSFSLCRFSCFPFFLLLPSSFWSSHCCRFFLYFFFSISCILFTLLWSHAETQKRIVRYVYTVCIMCWVAQSSRLFSCVVYAVFFFVCTQPYYAMLLLSLLLLPLHGQTFTINPRSYAFFFVSLLLILRLWVFVFFFFLLSVLFMLFFRKRASSGSFMDGRRSLLL